MVASGNCDAHLKNWSLLYPDGIQPRWSPLYDQVATIAYPRLDRELALRIGNAHSLHQVNRGHLRFVGKRAGLSEQRVDTIIDETLARLGGSFAEAPLDAPLARSLTEPWARCPLLREHPLHSAGAARRTRDDYRSQVTMPSPSESKPQATVG